MSRPNGPITFVKVVLKPISIMLGSVANRRERSAYPLHSPLSTSLKSTSKGTMTLKLRGDNRLKSSSISSFSGHAEIPFASSEFVANLQLQEYCKQQLMNRIASETVSTKDIRTQNDLMKDELEKLKKANKEWKSLNNEILSSILTNFNEES
eukprot:TRINITY_DN1936_c0_g2_i2.p2 TRINITY_DN1936_c0_g2~~TRINITY_DN1936_c0_g2_i2.p2  ORF type:complete len:152 (+),score=35.72 TRINITY_DN1936_c0_g2_i2:1300-1755(+)